MKNIKRKKIIKKGKNTIKNDKRAIKNDKKTIKKDREKIRNNRKTEKDKKTINKIKLICLIIIIGLTIILIKESKKDKHTQENNVLISETQDDKSLKEKEEEIKTSKTTDWNLILVNKDNKIPENYKFETSKIESENKVDKRIVEPITQMLNDARKDGVEPLICSSYRPSKTQQELFNKKVKEYKNKGYSNQLAEEQASYWVTLPRTSEHEIGLAVDIVSEDYQILDEEQEKTEVQKWLIEHCNNYGFILRYPTDKKEITKINYEPWHYRYVGVENAKFMKEKQYCLEEYIEYLKQYE